MSFGGHVADMIGRMKYNNSIRESYRLRYSKVKEAYAKEIKKRKIHKFKDSELSKEELIQVKEVIKQSIIRERRKAITKTVVVTVLCALIIVYLIYVFWEETN